MKSIGYLSLYNYLTQTENQKPWEAIRVLLRLRKTAPDLLLTLGRFIKGDEMADAERRGVTFSDLLNEDGMQPSQAILILDWIERDPEAAMQYMSEERFRSPIEPLTDEEAEKMRQAVAEFKKRGLVVDEKIVPESLEQLNDREKQDFELEVK